MKKHSELNELEKLIVYKLSMSKNGPIPYAPNSLENNIADEIRYTHNQVTTAIDNLKQYGIIKTNQNVSIEPKYYAYVWSLQSYKIKHSLKNIYKFLHYLLSRYIATIITSIITSVIASYIVVKFIKN